MENENQIFGEDLTGDDQIQDITEPSFAIDDSMYIALPEESKAEEELLTSEAQVEKLPIMEETEIADADFFDQPAIVDEKQKIVESIEGMTEMVEESTMEIDDEAKAEISETIEDTHTREVDFDATISIKESSLRDSSIPSSRTTSVTRESLELVDPSLRFPKQSVIRKFTIQYPQKARITGWESEVDDLMMGFDILKEPQLMLDEIAEEEEHVEEAVEEQEPVLVRAPYYEKYDKAMEEIAERKIRSYILQKKLAMYFKRKKMDFATKESDWALTLQIKYIRKLETWHEFILFDADERASASDEIQIRKHDREEQFSKLQNMFKQMQNREREIGNGLIYKKSGNVIADKLVDRLINRQKNQMKEVCTMRLTCIKLKQILNEKLAVIANLDEVSPGFLLANYEQLKVLNQSYADKIEERDEELTRLRSKCANTIQILAHIREKSTALDTDVTDLQKALAATERQFSRVRVELNQLKQKRDAYRHGIVKIKNESGLLTKPTLLRDMQEELDNCKELTQHLEACKQTNRKLAKRVKTIRLKIEEAKEMRKIPSRRILKKESAFPIASDSKPILYRGRPSLIVPFIDHNAFDCLKSIKPQFTYDRRLHAKCNKTK